jgi:hypothetical protein
MCTAEENLNNKGHDQCYLLVAFSSLGNTKNKNPVRLIQRIFVKQSNKVVRF